MSEGGFTNPTNHSYIYTVDRQARMIVFSLTFFLGIAGNAALLFVIKKKSKRSPNDFFIINLAFADLVLLLFALPLNLLIFQKTDIPESFCKFIWPMMTISNNVSIFTMSAMAIYRCQVIVHPLRPKIKRTIILLWIMSLWITSLVVMVPLMAVAKSSSGGWCYENWCSKNQRKSYTVALAVIQYILPLMVITAAYIRIGLDLKFSSLIQGRKSKYVVNSATRRKEDIHVIKTLAIIVFLFAIFMMPGQIAWILIDFGSSKYQKTAETLFKFYDLSVYFHCCLDPIVYGALMKRARHQIIQTFLKVFHLCCCCIEKALQNKNQSIDRDYAVGNNNKQSSTQSVKDHGRMMLLMHHEGRLRQDNLHTNIAGKESTVQKETVV